MCIEDIFDWIDRRNLVGRLSVEIGADMHSFECEQGMLVESSSSHPGEQLGQLLISRGFVDEKQLRDAFLIHVESGVSLGKVLVSNEVLAEKALAETLKLKFREAVWEVLSWQVGRFEFTETTQHRSEFKVQVPLRTTMELGQQQIERWRKIRALIPAGDVRFWIVDRHAAQDLVQSKRVRAQTEGLLRCIDNGLNVHQMVLLHHGRRFQIMSLLAGLVERRVVDIDRRIDGVRAKVETARQLEAAARGKLSQGKKSDALVLTARALEKDAENQQLRSLHMEIQRTLMAELSREFLNAFRIPRIVKGQEETDKMTFSSQERYVLGRIDGCWDLFSLMRLSPMHDVEVLMTCKRLRDRGVIDL